MKKKVLVGGKQKNIIGFMVGGYVSGSISYSMEECLENLRFYTKSYVCKVVSYEVEVIK